MSGAMGSKHFITNTHLHLYMCVPAMFQTVTYIDKWIIHRPRVPKDKTVSVEIALVEYPRQNLLVPRLAPPTRNVLKDGGSRSISGSSKDRGDEGGSTTGMSPVGIITTTATSL